jgi:hypothetical protein
MIQFPFWVQVVMAVSYIIAQMATTAFVLVVLWPSIRNQERRAQRLEAWCERQEVKDAIWKALDKIRTMDHLGGKPTTKADFAAGAGKGTNDL